LCTGLKDDDLAAVVHVSVRTVRRHIASIMEKLGVDTRFAAGVQIVKRGWI
jgi:DNA-binding NarL/FixJ family response regulator